MEDRVYRMTFEGLEVLGYEGVTDFCRYLVENGLDKDWDKVEVYRDDMLCLTVTNIPEAAKIVAKSDKWVRFDFKRRNKRVTSLTDAFK